MATIENQKTYDELLSHVATYEVAVDEKLKRAARLRERAARMEKEAERIERLARGIVTLYRRPNIRTFTEVDAEKIGVYVSDSGCRTVYMIGGTWAFVNRQTVITPIDRE
jgi:ribosomal protein S2